VQVDGHGDKSKLDEAQSRIRTLERHREELVDAFRKQMKLIDILKRQKVRRVSDKEEPCLTLPYT
jgi:tetrahydromethanopterin S-methyltransferase subunit A